MSLTLFPLNLPGQRYDSPMPFGLYDPADKLLQDFKTAGMYDVGLLAELEDCREKTGRDVPAVYREEGLAMFTLPVSTHGIPSNDDLVDLLKHASEQAAQDHQILHCPAELGRTALIAMLLSGYVMGLSGAEAIEWSGRDQPGAWLPPAHMYGGSS